MFFACERHEHEAAAKLLARFHGRLGHLDDRSGARRVVVGAVMNLAGRVLRHREAAAAAEMVVVGADDDDFRLQRRIAAFQHADDVANGPAHSRRAIERVTVTSLSSRDFGERSRSISSEVVSRFSRVPSAR